MSGFLVWFKNLGVLHVRIAYYILSRAMKRDEGYRESWQANIAMTIYDNSVINHEDCNKLADRIMKHLFDA